MKNNINHMQGNQNPCDPKNPVNPVFNDDKSGQCGHNDPDIDDLEKLLEECEANNKIGNGKANLCDEMTTGQILNNPENANRNVIYRYSKAIRGTDEAILDLFRKMVIIDENGKAHGVPVIWASQEKAVAAVVSDNVRKDESLVVDRIKLPMIAISSSDMQFNQNRYTYHKAVDWLRDGKTGRPRYAVREKREKDTVFGFTRGVPMDISYNVFAWTLYIEDMNQILEQIITKFSPAAYIKVKGVSWEVPVTIDSIANNLDTEPGDKAIRVIKFQFNLKAETYISQPIVRRKSVLKTTVEMVNGDESNVVSVEERLKENIKDLEC